MITVNELALKARIGDERHATYWKTFGDAIPDFFVYAWVNGIYESPMYAIDWSTIIYICSAEAD